MPRESDANFAIIALFSASPRPSFREGARILGMASHVHLHRRVQAMVAEGRLVLGEPLPRAGLSARGVGSVAAARAPKVPSVATEPPPNPRSVELAAEPDPTVTAHARGRPARADIDSISGTADDQGLCALIAKPDEEIDTSDIPEADEDWFRRARRVDPDPGPVALRPMRVDPHKLKATKLPWDGIKPWSPAMSAAQVKVR